MIVRTLTDNSPSLYRDRHDITQSLDLSTSLPPWLVIVPSGKLKVLCLACDHVSALFKMFRVCAWTDGHGFHCQRLKSNARHSGSSQPYLRSVFSSTCTSWCHLSSERSFVLSLEVYVYAISNNPCLRILAPVCDLALAQGSGPFVTSEDVEEVSFPVWLIFIRHNWTCSRLPFWHDSSCSVSWTCGVCVLSVTLRSQQLCFVVKVSPFY